MSETKPQNFVVHHHINVKTGVVILTLDNGDTEEGLLADGRSISILDFPTLYYRIGRRFSPEPMIPKMTRWSRFLRWLNIRNDMIENPEYNPSTFNIPDMRPMFKTIGVN